MVLVANATDKRCTVGAVNRGEEPGYGAADRGNPGCCACTLRFGVVAREESVLKVLLNVVKFEEVHSLRWGIRWVKPLNQLSDALDIHARSKVMDIEEPHSPHNVVLAAHVLASTFIS